MNFRKPLAWMAALLLPLIACASLINMSGPRAVTAAGASTIRFNPGIYVWVTPPAVGGISGFRIDIVDHKNYILDKLDTLESHTSIKGIQIAVWWKALEGSQDDYSAGIAALTDILDRAALRGKKVMVIQWITLYGNTASYYDNWPAYLVDGASYGITPFESPQVGASARFWQTATMDRLLAMNTAYAAAFDGNSTLEMWTLGTEPSLSGISSGLDGYDRVDALDEWIRWAVNARAAFPHTALRWPLNDLTPDSDMNTLMDAAVTNKVAVGGPDIWPGDITQADAVFQGKRWSDGVDSYTDRRELIPWVSEAQYQSFDGAWTQTEIWDAPISGYQPTNDQWGAGVPLPSMHPRYMIWYLEGASAYNEAAQLSFLDGKTDTGFNTRPGSY